MNRPDTSLEMKLSRFRTNDANIEAEEQTMQTKLALASAVAFE